MQLQDSAENVLNRPFRKPLSVKSDKQKEMEKITTIKQGNCNILVMLWEDVATRYREWSYKKK